MKRTLLFSLCFAFLQFKLRLLDLSKDIYKEKHIASDIVTFSNINCMDGQLKLLSNNQKNHRSELVSFMSAYKINKASLLVCYFFSTNQELLASYPRVNNFWFWDSIPALRKCSFLWRLDWTQTLIGTSHFNLPCPYPWS